MLFVCNFYVYYCLNNQLSINYMAKKSLIRPKIHAHNEILIRQIATEMTGDSRNIGDAVDILCNYFISSGFPALSSLPFVLPMKAEKLVYDHYNITPKSIKENGKEN